MHTQAAKDYTRAIELSPDDFLYWYNRSTTHYSLGRYEEALADANQSLLLNAEDAESYNQRGIVFMALGRNKARAPGCFIA